MAKKPPTKIEVISSDDPDIDCFGNFSNKEKICTKECGLSSQCVIVTKSLADDKNKLYQIKTAFDDDINSSKKILGDNKYVVDLKKKLEEKHKEVKKQMSKDSDKKIVKKKIKSDKDEIKNIVKAPKKSSEESNGDKKKVKSEKKPKKVSFETVHNSVIPTAFESLYKFSKKLDGAELVKKSSVTNVKMANGIVFCFTKTGTTDSKLSIYINRSAGYEGFGKSSEVDIVNHSKGDFILNVKNSDKSRNEAIKLLSKWVKDRDSFMSSQKSSGKPKKAKADKEEKSSDKTKKVKSSDKAEKSSDGGKAAKAKKAKGDTEKPSKSSSDKKKETPDVKPSKKAKFEDEEG